MKQFIFAVAAVFCATVWIPFMAFESQPEGSWTSLTPVMGSAPSPVGSGEEQIFRVKDLSSDDILEVSALDYIKGAIAAEMPPTFHIEALKAQGVAAYTYVSYLQEVNRQLAEGAKDYDIEADVENVKTFITEDRARALYGDQFEEYWAIISQAASEAAAYLLTYDGAPIVSVYHAMSPGKTESSENIWGTALPYLIPVESEGDLQAPGYSTSVFIDPDFIAQQLESANKTADFSQDKSSWFEILSTSSSGTVLSAEVCGIEMKGTEIRELLGLRSAAFTVSYTNDTFCFTCLGYGHGVGLSQYGANAMANEGKTFQEILMHYYPNAALSGQ